MFQYNTQLLLFIKFCKFRFSFVREQTNLSIHFKSSSHTDPYKSLPPKILIRGNAIPPISNIEACPTAQDGPRVRQAKHPNLPALGRDPAFLAGTVARRGSPQGLQAGAARRIFPAPSILARRACAGAAGGKVSRAGDRGGRGGRNLTRVREKAASAAA